MEPGPLGAGEGRTEADKTAMIAVAGGKGEQGSSPAGGAGGPFGGSGPSAQWPILQLGRSGWVALGP